jgi:hypothetical protein
MTLTRAWILGALCCALMASKVGAAPGQAGGQPVDPAAFEKARRAMTLPLQVHFDPHLAGVPACHWRELDAKSKQKLLAAAESDPPFVLVVADFERLHINMLPTTERCDPAWQTHARASMTAMKIGLIEGVSVARLGQRGVTRDQLEKVWREDSMLRETLAALFQKVSEGAMSDDDQATLRPVLEAAWVRLGRPSSHMLVGGSPQMAAYSYWMARGWETVVIEPLTVARPKG